MDEPLGWIYLLPSNTQSVLVQYSPKWKISCVLPKKQRNIQFKFHTCNDWGCQDIDKKFDITTPPLIMSHSWIPPWVGSTKRLPYFEIFTLDTTSKKHICAVPYRLANVYDSGRICLGGGISANDIATLRKANNLFWSSPFNLDNCPLVRQHQLNCSGVQHHYEDHYEIEESCECRVYLDEQTNTYEVDYDALCTCEVCQCACCVEICSCQCDCNMVDLLDTWVTSYSERPFDYIRMTNHFCGKKYFGSSKPIKALFISNQPDKLEINSNQVRKDYRNTACVVGIATKIDKECWDIDLGSSSIKINNDKVRCL